VLAYVKSDIGMVRKTNEDNYIFLPPHLFVVADGMGGHAAGEIASKISVETVKQYITTYNTSAEPECFLKQAIVEANKAVFEMAQQKSECSGMGTTFSAAYIIDDTIHWGHVGDSRIYLFHNNQLKQITNDHSLVWDLVRNGNITEAEAHTHPHRNILTRALGTNEHIDIDTGTIQWEQGDMLLFCTDGLTNMVSNDDICHIMQNCTASRQEMLDILIQKANIAGGIDNITAILVQYGAE
jgi:protein phosphatase